MFSFHFRDYWLRGTQRRVLFNWTQDMTTFLNVNILLDANQTTATVYVCYQESILSGILYTTDVMY